MEEGNEQMDATTEEPTEAPAEEQRDDDRRDRFDRGPREMHQAKCSECGKDCEVPFKPTEGRPVYCRDCFSKKKQY